VVPAERGCAVVTGAGSGIGRATAQHLAAAGFHVAAVGRRLETLQETAASAGSLDGSIEAIPGDVTDPGSVSAVFEQVGRGGRRLDVLVNSAGLFGASAEVADLAVEDWSVVLDTNVTGTFLCCRAAYAMMRDQRPQGGRIINIGSVSAHAPRPHSVAYTASKHAVTGITKSIALDGRPHGIACGQIDIGNAATEMTAAFQEGVRQADGELRPEPVFDVTLAAQAIAAMAQLPPSANVLFTTLMATTMPYVGRG
jgi:NAD(P)-dependent dehydrogenase (short-subunit alcohol dehydrogenase family)